jgi:hypothetical protein
VLSGKRGFQAGVVIVGSLNLKTFRLQKSLQQVNQPVIVIHDEQTVHGFHSRLSNLRRW